MPTGGSSRAREPLTDVVVYGAAFAAFAVTLAPFLYVAFRSISTPEAIFYNQIIFFPDGVYLDSYRLFLSNGQVLRYYANTIAIVTAGTACNVVLAFITAFVLSRRDYVLRNYLMAFIVITMFFSGGLIPFYMVVRGLGILNTRWSLVLPFALSPLYVIIARTFMQSAIPEDLFESAAVDGAPKWTMVWSIAAPLSKPLMAVIALWAAVYFWNSFFWATVFVVDPDKQPIQVWLRRLLTIGSSNDAGLTMEATFATQSGKAEQMKFVAIMVTIIPILSVYPFLQRFFVKGVVIGALKH